MITRNPGVLNKVAKLQRLNQSKKSNHGFRSEESWETIKTFRCNVITEESKSIRTVYKQGAVTNLDYKIVTCRYLEDLRHDDRLVINGKPFDIEIINNVEEANREYRLWVKGTNV